MNIGVIIVLALLATLVVYMYSQSSKDKAGKADKADSGAGIKAGIKAGTSAGTSTGTSAGSGAGSIIIRKPDVFSADLVSRNAAVLCSKGDPLKNGGIYRVVSPNSIAWYPSVPIAQSWDPNWRDAVKVDCTGATAAPTMQQK